MNTIADGIDDAAQYAAHRRDHWDRLAARRQLPGAFSRCYHARLLEVFRGVVPPGMRVLEVGCGQGDLLAALQPAHGCGVDFSAEMLKLAQASHPQLRLCHADAHDLSVIDERFDYVILSDLVNDVWDVQGIFEAVQRACHPHTRVIINLYSHLWEPILKGSARLGLSTSRLEQNWLTLEDVENLLGLANFEVIRSWQEVLFPAPVPGLGSLADRYLVKLWPFRYLALTNFVLARPAPSRNAKPQVSVIVPARNEAGNAAGILRRIPELGAGTEIVFVEGHSRDNTYEAIVEAIAANPQRDCKVFRQEGIGKADAVRLGFSRAKGDILLILDADLTVRPEDLPRFVEALTSGCGEFINGVRLIYPMQDQAMRFLNLLGNKFFSLAFSWLLGQSIKDTLCGTKAVWRDAYQLIARNRSYFGEFDPFGDFDLLFGAAKLGLKIVDLPVRYQARIYGTTNIHRWRHGLLLLQMVAFAARRIKFV